MFWSFCRCFFDFNFQQFVVFRRDQFVGIIKIMVFSFDQCLFDLILNIIEGLFFSDLSGDDFCFITSWFDRFFDNDFQVVKAVHVLDSFGFAFIVGRIGYDVFDR